MNLLRRRPRPTPTPYRTDGHGALVLDALPMPTPPIPQLEVVGVPQTTDPQWSYDDYDN